MKDLDRLASLEKDWDGEGADPPQPKSIEAARKILGYAPTPCRILPTLDGGIILEWQPEDSAIFEVEIERDGKAELMVHNPGQPPQFFALN